MIKAKSETEKGPVYVFGLTHMNVALMMQGRPILIDLKEMGGEGEVIILFGKSEESIFEQFKREGLLHPEFTLNASEDMQ